MCFVLVVCSSKEERCIFVMFVFFFADGVWVLMFIVLEVDGCFAGFLVKLAGKHVWFTNQCSFD